MNPSTGVAEAMAAAGGGLTGIDWAIMVVYLVGLVTMSYKLGQGQESVEDYYLGGNSLSWWAIGLSTMSTQLSTNSMLGIPAFVALKAVSDGGGFSILQGELALPLAVLVVMAVLHPFFRSAGVISVYEFLELRFGVRTRTLLSVFFQLSRALGTGVTVYSAALIFEIALGMPLWASIILMGTVTIIYDTLGGMAAVVWSDVIQMGIIFAGVLLCTYLALDQVGGLSAALQVLHSEPARFTVLRTHELGLAKGEDYSFWAMLIGFFFLYASYYGCDQSQVQRQLSSKDIDEARLSLFLNGALRFFMVLLLCGMGVAVGAFLLTDESSAGFLEVLRAQPKAQNQMVVYYVLNFLPVGIRGLIIVAIFSAAMSSLDSAINSLSATTMRDIYERFIEPEPSPETHLSMSKKLTVAWGVVCTGAAFFTEKLGENVVIVVNKVGSLTYGPILGVFLLAIFSRRATDRGAIAGALGGLGLNLALMTFTEVSWLWWNATGCLAAVAVGLVVSRLDPPPDPEALEGLVYAPGVEARFACRRNWKLYYFALVLAFVAFLGVCAGIQALGPPTPVPGALAPVGP